LESACSRFTHTTPTAPLRHTQYNSVKAGKGGVQLGDGSNKNKKSKVAPEPGEDGGGGGAIVYPYETKAVGKKKKTHKVKLILHQRWYIAVEFDIKPG
jgi:hypothetical protein